MSSTDLVSSYNSANLFCNVSINGKTSTGDYAYRGDLVLIEGEIADTQGRRKPPEVVLRQAILLASDSKISMLIGAVHDLAQVGLVFERYAKDFDAGVLLLFFADNIRKPLQSDIGGFRFAVLPIEETAVWNETIEELRLEKDDFKGQSAEEKLLTLKKALLDHKPSGDTIAFSDADKYTFEVKREGRGPV